MNSQGLRDTGLKSWQLTNYHPNTLTIANNDVVWLGQGEFIKITECKLGIQRSNTLTEVVRVGHPVAWDKIVYDPKYRHEELEILSLLLLLLSLLLSWLFSRPLDVYTCCFGISGVFVVSLNCMRLCRSSKSAKNWVIALWMMLHVMTSQMSHVPTVEISFCICCIKIQLLTRGSPMTDSESGIFADIYFRELFYFQ